MEAVDSPREGSVKPEEPAEIDLHGDVARVAFHGATDNYPYDDFEVEAQAYSCG
jgi:hypothetical protein